MWLHKHGSYRTTCQNNSSYSNNHYLLSTRRYKACSEPGPALEPDDCKMCPPGKTSESAASSIEDCVACEAGKYQDGYMGTNWYDKTTDTRYGSTHSTYDVYAHGTTFRPWHTMLTFDQCEYAISHYNWHNHGDSGDRNGTPENIKIRSK